MLKNWFERIVKSNRKTLLLNWETLKRERATFSSFLDSKNCARWVPQKLTDGVKAEKVKVSRELLGHFEEESERFLWWIVTSNETWVHHYVPENRSQSVEHCHEGSPAPEKLKTKLLLEKSSWLYSGTLKVLCLLTSWGKGTTVNLERCIESLKSLKNTSQGRGQKLIMSCFNKTMLGLAQVLPQPTACILLLSISTCSPNCRRTWGDKTSIIMNKARL